MKKQLKKELNNLTYDQLLDIKHRLGQSSDSNKKKIVGELIGGSFYPAAQSGVLHQYLWRSPSGSINQFTDPTNYKISMVIGNIHSVPSIDINGQEFSLQINNSGFDWTYNGYYVGHITSYKIKRKSDLDQPTAVKDPPLPMSSAYGDASASAAVSQPYAAPTAPSAPPYAAPAPSQVPDMFITNIQFEDPHDCWNNYDSIDLMEINRILGRFQDDLYSQRFQIRIRGQLYEIDLSHKTQKNISTGFIRNIRFTWADWKCDICPRIIEHRTYQGDTFMFKCRCGHNRAIDRQSIITQIRNAIRIKSGAAPKQALVSTKYNITGKDAQIAELMKLEEFSCPICTFDNKNITQRLPDERFRCEICGEEYADAYQIQEKRSIAQKCVKMLTFKDKQYNLKLIPEEYYEIALADLLGDNPSEENRRSAHESISSYLKINQETLEASMEICIRAIKHGDGINTFRRRGIDPERFLLESGIIGLLASVLTRCSEVFSAGAGGGAGYFGGSASPPTSIQTIPSEIFSVINNSLLKMIQLLDYCLDHAISPVECLSILLYTGDSGSRHNIYKQLNKDCREGREVDWKWYRIILTQALSKIHSTIGHQVQNNQTVWRGINSSDLRDHYKRNATVNKIIKLTGFVSTSFSAQTALQFIGHNGFVIKFIITNTEVATKLNPISLIETEDEILFNEDTTFRVIRWEKIIGDIDIDMLTIETYTPVHGDADAYILG